MIPTRPAGPRRAPCVRISRLVGPGVIEATKAKSVKGNQDDMGISSKVGSVTMTSAGVGVWKV